MNKNNHLKALFAGLILSAPLLHANGDHSEYFAYDVSGVKVVNKTSGGTTPQVSNGASAENAFAGEIIFLDTPQDQAATPNTTTQQIQQPEIVYTEAPVSNTAAASVSVTYDNTPVQAPLPATQGSSYAMYADTSLDQPGDANVANLQPIASKPAAPKVSAHEIQQAIKTGRVDLVSALHAKGADLLSPGYLGMTNLHKAAAAGNLSLVKYLVGIGASPNTNTEKNWTPLHHAARFGHSDVVQYLLSAGADRHHKTSDGLSPAQLAINVKNMQVAGMLR